MGYTILTVDKVKDPRRVALWASAILSADKGIPNRIERIDDSTFDVVTDTNQAHRFIRK